MFNTYTPNFNEELRSRLDHPAILNDGWEDYYEEWFTTLSDETKVKIFDDVAKIIPEIEAKVNAFEQTDLAVQNGYFYINDNELCYMYEALCGDNHETLSNLFKKYGWSHDW